MLNTPPPTTETAPVITDFDLWAFAEAEAERAGISKPATTFSPARVAKRFMPAVEWIERNVWDWSKVKMTNGYDFSESKKIVLDQYQKDILNYLLTPKANGRFPYSTIIWSQPKKHGKTQIAAGVGAWYSEEIESPNLVLCVGDSKEQATGLIFKSALPTFAALGADVPKSAESGEPIIKCQNGTIFKAIPANPTGQAGLNYGLTLFSELWTYKTENHNKLWSELTPVPTRGNSLRWVETYCGYEDESSVLLEQYLRIFADTTETELREPDEKHPYKPRPVPELMHIQTDGHPACWHIPEEGLFYFCDHEIRASWLTGENAEFGRQYIREQKGGLTYSQFVRLWENRWQSSVGNYILPEWWTDSLNLTGERNVPMVLAGDASQRNDTTALVGVEKVHVPIFGELQERYRVCKVRVWNPLGKDIDLDETIAASVQEIFESGLMLPPFYYDPAQMHQVAVNLRKKRVPCVEFNQGTERLKADTFLWSLFKRRLIDCFPHPTLGKHLRAAKAKENDFEQMRIIKGKLSNAGKIDAAVALSMAAWKVSKYIPPPPARKSSSYSPFG